VSRGSYRIIRSCGERSKLQRWRCGEYGLRSSAVTSGISRVLAVLDIRTFIKISRIYQYREISQPKRDSRETIHRSLVEELAVHGLPGLLALRLNDVLCRVSRLLEEDEGVHSRRGKE
jgi:hypothetical protein